MHGLLHDHVAHVGEEKAGDAFLFTVLENAIPAATVDAGHEDRIIAGQLIPQIIECAVVHQFFGDLVETAAGLSLYRTEPVFVLLVAVDQDGVLAWIQLEVEAVGPVGPYNVKDSV